MLKKILWIEDEYYALQGLLLPLEQLGFEIVMAATALEGFHKAQSWQEYDMIVLDLILPFTDVMETIPVEIESWKDENYIGVPLAKWLKQRIRVQCPVLLLSVVGDPIEQFKLDQVGLFEYLPKRGLLPSVVKGKILDMLKCGIN